MREEKGGSRNERREGKDWRKGKEGRKEERGRGRKMKIDKREK